MDSWAYFILVWGLKTLGAGITMFLNKALKIISKDKYQRKD